MKLRDRLILPENLSYAWRKVWQLSQMNDGYTDFFELAEFELNLAHNLEKIRTSFAKATYKTKKVRPLPRPKKIANSIAISREYFQISIEDQVAWIALVNAIGPHVDKIMPPWSYGNRLYRPAWYEETEGRKSELEEGPYRHASGHLYRKFKHSWPMFRRHIHLAAQYMSTGSEPSLVDEPDSLAIATGKKSGLVYFDTSFWNQKAVNDQLFFAGIDLSQFYPSIEHKSIVRSLETHVAGLADDADLLRMISAMLKFRVDGSELTNAVCQNVEPNIPKKNTRGIPTGLFVGGFLANVAMLPLDLKVDSRIKNHRNVAHFRFVDDHCVLAYSLESLCDWIEWYQTELLNEGIGPEINTDKFDPPLLGKFLNERKRPRATQAASKKLASLQTETSAVCSVAGSKPTKLLTKTLALVSDIGATNFDTLDDIDIGNLLANLEWLLLADLPEREIRADTRVSFAAGQIARLSTILVEETDGLVEASRRIADLQAVKVDQNDLNALARQRKEIASAGAHLKRRITQHEARQRANLKHRFELLLGALKEHPGKARLFIRVVDFCRTTGFQGIVGILDWIKDLRRHDNEAWASYYAGLLIQLLALNALRCSATVSQHSSLRSDLEASLSHLDDMNHAEFSELFGSNQSLAWFHYQAVVFFHETLGICATQLSHIPELELHSDRMQRLVSRNSSWLLLYSERSLPQFHARPKSIPVHFAEAILQRSHQPSFAWRELSERFDFRDKSDLTALRRYPNSLSSSQWIELISSFDFKDADSGWLREAIGNDADRKKQIADRPGRAFQIASTNIDARVSGYIDIAQWSSFLKHDCDAFDPRAGEWTALEIIARILEPSAVLEGGYDLQTRIHPNNVFVPAIWANKDPFNSIMSWDEWREKMKGNPIVLSGSAAILDYRYLPNDSIWNEGPNWDGRLHSIGRLLLELLCHGFSAPPLWNIKGNEYAVPLPVSSVVERIGISSKTQDILDAALGRRARETRAISREPLNFGWEEGRLPNDTKLDPDALRTPKDLLAAMREAQASLRENQISVSRNQPRQLIPVTLNSMRHTDVFEAPDEQGGVDG
jgi:hypothetical protein